MSCLLELDRGRQGSDTQSQPELPARQLDHATSCMSDQLVGNLKGGVSTRSSSSVCTPSTSTSRLQPVARSGSARTSGTSGATGYITRSRWRLATRPSRSGERRSCNGLPFPQPRLPLWLAYGCTKGTMGADLQLCHFRRVVWFRPGLREVCYHQRVNDALLAHAHKERNVTESAAPANSPTQPGRPDDGPGRRPDPPSPVDPPQPGPHPRPDDPPHRPVA